ncbi:MAG: class I SAM-dependent methyltransferase [bacterium]
MANDAPDAAKPVRVLDLYRGLGFRARLQALQRWLCTPYPAVEKFVPPSGVILDLGAGTGMFANCMALASPRRLVIGVDISEGKIAVANRTIRDRKNISFRVADLRTVPIERCSAVTFYDVLHHLSYNVQEDILMRCREKLVPSGVLVIKENSTRPLWKHLVNHAVESAAAGFRVTTGEGIHFRTPEQWESLLRRIGFTVETTLISTRHPWSHIVFVCGKTGDP